MSSIFFVMSVAANAITNNAILDSALDPIWSLPDVRYERLDAGCSSCVHEFLKTCNERGIVPGCIGICTKGEAQEGAITLQRGATPYPIKQILESQFAIPVAILNRFQAFSFGAFCLLNKTGTDSLGVINLSNGVGCGVIKDGQLIQEYDRDIGMGGLQRGRRLSDGRQMTIAQIAGIEALRAQARYQRCGIGKLFEDGVNDRNRESSACIRDIAHAVALLAGNTARRYGIFDFCINVYDSCGLASADKQRFVDIIKAEIPSTSEMPINLDLFTHKLKEDEVKTFGVARFASMVCPPEEMRYRPFNKIFVVTGLPSSGKSTFMQRLLALLRERRINAGGIITEETRGADRKRTGFVAKSHFSRFRSDSHEIAVLKTQIRGDRRRDYVPFKNTPYAVNVASISQFVIPNLQKACMEEDVIIIDEIGGMQLYCHDFQREIRNISLSLQKPVIFTVPWNSNDPLVTQIKAKAQTTVVLEPGNREGSQQRGIDMLLPALVPAPPVSE
ncbi:MAG: ROK family protein [Holosporales bacterium]|jgi:nucleoside-triphosphatase THEP1|nr:ROK family protein [Holosporales bacterium]